MRLPAISLPAISLITASLLLAQPAFAAAPAEAAQDQADTTDWDAVFGVEKKVPDPLTGELPVVPYVQADANAGASPLAGQATAEAFGGAPGIRAIVDRLVELSAADPRISAIFAGQDLVRLRRTLFEQVCFILNAGCRYSGRDMKSAHQGLGITRADMNALVENLQRAMRDHDVPFAAQNRLLAKLAPMAAHVIER